MTSGNIRFLRWTTGLLLLLVTGHGSLVTSTNLYPCCPGGSSLPNGLIGYWKLDGNGNDSAGSNPGTVNGASTVTGQIGNALSFNGTSDDVIVPHNSSLNVGDVWSWSLWCKRTRTNVTEVLVNKALNIYNILFYNSGAVPNGIQLAKENVGLIANSTTSITDTNWHFIVVTKNGAAVHIYIDNADVTSAVTNFTTADTTNVLGFGVSINASDVPAGWFSGSMDEIGLWNRAITSGEVALLWNGGVGRTHPF